MSTMASRLDELLRSQRRFIADASHQLRTPLTALRLRLDNIQSQLPGQSTAELDAAIDETTRLAALVTSLLQLARADEHHATGIADLSRLTTDRVDTWSAVADANGVTLIADTPPGNTLVEADPAAVEQILDNLLDNALNASPPGSTITARVTSHPATRDLTVSDQGTGLSDEDKILATQRFWRGSTTTSGTGLGLAIVDSLATASHATIHLADSPEGGLAVTISFPAPNPTTGQSGGDV
jgi:signal transduction histidine kinase